MIDKFIEFVIDLANEDEIFIGTKFNAKMYFINGGCYELYKIVKHYYPNTKCVITKTNDHCAILYENKIYDAKGVRTDVENFKIANINDIEYMDNYFGLHINTLEAPNLIKELNDCNIEKRLK